MAEWKKVIVSGSDAQLNQLEVDNTITGSLSGSVTGTLDGIGSGSFSGSFEGDGSNLTGITAGVFVETGSIFATTNDLEITGSLTVIGSVTSSVGFTGSFVGDGSNLTGLPEAAIATYTNPGNNRIVTSVDANTVNSETNLTFDGSTLMVDGDINVSGDTTLNGNTTLGDADGDTVTINGETVKLTNIPAGTDNTVLVLNEENNIVIDEIDSRVWGSTLIDGSLTSGRVPYASDSNTITDNAGLTFDGTTLVANEATITNDLLVSGDLTVSGTASFQHADSLQVADRFILLASGSNAAGMGGLVIQQATQNIGEVFSWDNTTSRWASTGSFNAALNTFTPEAFMASVIDVDEGNSDIAKYQKNGNIKVDGGEIYIYS